MAAGSEMVCSFGMSLVVVKEGKQLDMSNILCRAESICDIMQKVWFCWDVGA